MQFKCPRCDRQYEALQRGGVASYSLVHDALALIGPAHLCPSCWAAFQKRGQREVSRCKACLDDYVVAAPYLRWSCCKSCWDDFEKMQREQEREAGAAYEDLVEGQPSMRDD